MNVYALDVVILLMTDMSHCIISLQIVLYNITSCRIVFYTFVSSHVSLCCIESCIVTLNESFCIVNGQPSLRPSMFVLYHILYCTVWCCFIVYPDCSPKNDSVGCFSKCPKIKYIQAELKHSKVFGWICSYDENATQIWHWHTDYKNHILPEE